MSNQYHSIIRHYENCLKRHGDSYKGVDWPSASDALKRYRVMLDLVRATHTPLTLLDFGCGVAHLYQYIIDNDIKGLRYEGLDASPAFIEICKKKYPHIPFKCVDAFAVPEGLTMYDYIVMNGVFTEKCSLSFDDMYDYLCRMLNIVFKKTRYGIAFNVMSKKVDWERDDLFHVPVGELTDFIVNNLSRHYVLRNDYGLYEYTLYVYKEAG